jgi:hypothetical protein
MTARAALCVLMTLLVAAVGAAPAAGQDRRTAGLPRELWDPLPSRAAPAGEPQGHDVIGTLLLTGLALGAAAVAGFLLTGVRAAGPAPAPETPVAAPPIPRSRAPRFQGCSIALSRSSTTSEFRVVVGKGAERRVVGRSQRFPAPRSGPLPDDGPARAALDELLERLQAVGWIAVGNESDVWHRVQLVRPRRTESPVEHAVIDAFGDGFAAFTSDDYGNPLRLAERAVGIDQSPEDAHAELVAELEADGWQVAGEGDSWYATTLTRRGLALVP